MQCELKDFKTIRAMVQYDDEKDKTNPLFLVRIGDRDMLCEITYQVDRNERTQYDLLLPDELTLEELRQKIEMILLTASKKVSKARIKKTKVIDAFAKQVKDIDFFPQTKKQQTIFKLFSPLATSVHLKLFNGNHVEELEMNYDDRGF